MLAGVPGGESGAAESVSRAAHPATAGARQSSPGTVSPPGAVQAVVALLLSDQ